MKILRKKLNIPLIMFDMPFNHTYEVPEHSVKYMRGQIEYAIKQLEDFTKKKFDYDKFGQVMELSNATCEWWKKATDWAKSKTVPAQWF